MQNKDASAERASEPYSVKPEVRTYEMTRVRNVFRDMSQRTIRTEWIFFKVPRKRTVGVVSAAKECCIAKKLGK